MTNRYFYAKPIIEPKSVIPHLAKQERHWRKGYSAYELVHSWIGAKGIPEPVAAVLRQAEELQRLELIEGFFEKETDLRTRGRPSQTDLLALVGNESGLIVLGVEGKVDETFGPRVEKWIEDTSENKRVRLFCLQRTLRLSDDDIPHLRYQLLHRTAATIYEAQRYMIRRAVMVVHSFSKSHRWFDDFRAFAEAIGAPVSRTNQLSESVRAENVSLQLAWVADSPEAGSVEQGR